MKYITAKAHEFFPTLPKKATWGEAFDVLNDSLGVTIGIYDKIKDDKTKVFQFEVFKGDDLLVKTEYTGDDRLKFITGPGDFNWELIYQTAVEFCIANKVIKKPRKSRAKVSEDEKAELLKQRQRLSMKISAWNRQGKDTTELVKERKELNNKIKQL